MNLMKDFNDLVQDFRNQATRDQLGPALALIAPGDFQGFIAWGAENGYTLTLADVQKGLADEKLAQAFQRSDVLRGWITRSPAAAPAGKP
jgi:hypothetical protein